MHLAPPFSSKWAITDDVIATPLPLSGSGIELNRKLKHKQGIIHKKSSLITNLIIINSFLGILNVFCEEIINHRRHISTTFEQWDGFIIYLGFSTIYLCWVHSEHSCRCNDMPPDLEHLQGAHLYQLLHSSLLGTHSFYVWKITEWNNVLLWWWMKLLGLYENASRGVFSHYSSRGNTVLRTSFYFERLHLVSLLFSCFVFNVRLFPCLKKLKKWFQHFAKYEN